MQRQLDSNGRAADGGDVISPKLKATRAFTVSAAAVSHVRSKIIIRRSSEMRRRNISIFLFPVSTPAAAGNGYEKESGSAV